MLFTDIDREHFTSHLYLHQLPSATGSPVASETQGATRSFGAFLCYFEIGSPRRCPVRLNWKTWKPGYKSPMEEFGQWETRNRKTFCSTVVLSDAPHTEKLSMFVTWLQPAQKCTLLCGVFFYPQLIFPHSIFPEISIFLTHKMLAYKFSFQALNFRESGLRHPKVKYS